MHLHWHSGSLIDCWAVCELAGDSGYRIVSILWAQAIMGIFDLGIRIRIHSRDALIV